MSYDPYGRARHAWAGDVDFDSDRDASDAAFYSVQANLAPIAGVLSPDSSGNVAYHPDADIDRDGDVDAADADLHALLTPRPVLGGTNRPDLAPL